MRGGEEVDNSVCVYGYADCDDDADNGCETEVFTSREHCGDCSTTCPNDRTCLSGRCLEDGQVASVSAGIIFTCALRAPGDVWCWGNNEPGTLGRGYVSEAEPVPARVEGLDDVVQVGAAGRMACALRRDGAIFCWGWGFWNALGNEEWQDAYSPVRAYDVPGATQMRCWGAGVLVLQRSGTIWGWGDNDDGQLGSGLPGSTLSQTQGIDDAVYISALNPSCAVRPNGQALCWGDNSYKEVGPFPQQSFPLPFELDLPPVSRIDPGYFRTCATLRDGTAMCWGDSSLLPLEYEPSAVVGLMDAVETLAAHYHRCALLASGEVHCWGINYVYYPGPDGGSGLLGRGFSSENTAEPLPVDGLDDAVDITVGSVHTCAVRASGELVCWGGNGYGQLGDGTLEAKGTPVAVVFDAE